MAAPAEWCLIESDPGVFTELIRGFGVQGTQVEELWSLDETSFENLKPIHGLIFLYKWVPGEPQGTLVQDSRVQDIFFAKQVIKNACATQAILSVLLNIDHSDVELGQSLIDFKDFSKQLSPADRGLCLTNSDSIRSVHNSFARQHMFEFDEQLSKKDDAYHFVAYVPINGRLYELDGLQDGPLDHGSCDQNDWLKSARPVVQKRINSYAADEIHFNLLAIVSEKKRLYEREMSELEGKKQLAIQKIEALLSGEEVAMEDDSNLPDDPEDLQTCIENWEARVADLTDRVYQEDVKMERYRLENIRRRHNYLPLIMEVLKLLARRGQLVSLCEQAQKKKKQQAQTKASTTGKEPPKA